MGERRRLQTQRVGGMAQRSHYPSENLALAGCAHAQNLSLSL